MNPNAGAGITVVIPAFNESASIEKTLDVLKRTLQTLSRPTEVIVVNDGSVDNTAALAVAADVRVINHPINSGYGRSILTGVDSAKYETIAIVDADGTYPIEVLPDLLKLYDQGFDMVVGSRQGKHYQASISKRLLRIIFRSLAEFTCGRSIPDINSGFRVFRRRPVLMERESISSGFSFTTTITLLFMLNHLFVG